MRRFLSGTTTGTRAYQHSHCPARRKPSSAVSVEDTHTVADTLGIRHARRTATIISRRRRPTHYIAHADGHSDDIFAAISNRCPDDIAVFTRDRQAYAGLPCYAIIYAPERTHRCAAR